MGEMSDTYKSDEEKAIERVARQRFEQIRSVVGTDATDRTLFDEILREVKDEFVLLNGRQPGGIM